MTPLLERPTTAGATLYPSAPTAPAGVQAAEDFYLCGPCRQVRQIAIQDVGVDGRPRRWLASHVQQHMNALLRLGPGWDGHRALPLTEDAVQAAITVVFAVADDLSVPPQLFPLPDGGIQLEWHAGQSVEIEVDRDGQPHVFATDAAGAVVINSSLVMGDRVALMSVRRAIADLSARLTGAR